MHIYKQYIFTCRLKCSLVKTYVILANTRRYLAYRILHAKILKAPCFKLIFDWNTPKEAYKSNFK